MRGICAVRRTWYGPRSCPPTVRGQRSVEAARGGGDITASSVDPPEAQLDLGGSARLLLHGDLGITADEALAQAFAAVTGSGAERVLLDCNAVDYINSTGIALIVRLLAEARRDRREVVALGLGGSGKRARFLPLAR